MLIKNSFGTYDVPKCLEAHEQRLAALEAENAALKSALAGPPQSEPAQSETEEPK